jgi:hypothetical protein
MSITNILRGSKVPICWSKAILRLENIWDYLTIYAKNCGYFFIAAT